MQDSSDTDLMETEEEDPSYQDPKAEKVPPPGPTSWDPPVVRFLDLELPDDLAPKKVVGKKTTRRS